MKIVVNNIAASKGGAMSILKEFYDYIKHNDSENEWIFLLADKYIDETENIKVITLPKVKSKWINRLKFDFFLGKKLINEIKPHVVFSLQNTIIFGAKSKQVLYVQQSIPFQSIKKFSFIKKDERVLAIYQHIIGNIIKLSIKKSDSVIVQAKWMKESVISSTKVCDKKVKVVKPNITNIEISKKVKLEKNSFFYPTSNSIYKNNNCIYEACKILNKNKINNFEVKLTIDKDYLDLNNIKCIGNIPRQKVIKEYSKSILIFPSFIETVGLPLLEAMKIGGIIFASDCQFSREVLDNYENAYFFNPFDPNELALLMSKAINGEIEIKDINKSDKSKNSWNDVKNIILEIGDKNFA